MKKIAVQSVPRSGSSWLGQIFNSSPNVIFRFQPLFSYAFKNYLDENSSRDKIDEFFKKIALSNDDFLIQQDKIDRGIYPEFKKNKMPTHIVYKEVRYNHLLENMLSVHPTIKVIGLIRNPLAVMYSFFNAPREFRRDLGWNELEEWRAALKKNLGKKEEFFGYEKWKQVAYLFHKLEEQHPDNFFLIRYSELIQHSITVTKKLFNFCEIVFEKQTEEFLKISTERNQNDPYAVFKKRKVDTNWQGRLNPLIVEEIIKDLRGTELEIYLSY